MGHFRISQRTKDPEPTYYNRPPKFGCGGFFIMYFLALAAILVVLIVLL